MDTPSNEEIIDISPDKIIQIPIEEEIKPIQIDWSNVGGVSKPDNNANNRGIFAQNAAPTGNYEEGDLWFDTDDNNKIYRANSALTWVSVADGLIATKVAIFKQASIPTSVTIGDLWFDSDDGNRPYRAEAVGATTIAAGQWVLITPSNLAIYSTDLGAIVAGTIVMPTTGYIRGGQTDYQTGTGFFLGYSGAAYKFSVGNPAGDYLAWDATNILLNGYVVSTQLLYSAGDYLVYSNDTEVGADPGAYALKKQCRIPKPGTLRIKFDLNTAGAGNAAYGKIYRNGVAIGTERVDSDGTYTTYSEDITGWSRGDLVQLYGHGTTPSVAQLKNFRIYSIAPDVITTE